MDRPSILHPEMLSRRSFVYRKLAQLGARFAEHDGAAVAEAVRGESTDAAAVPQLALADLSPLKRVGFKGAGAADWVGSQGLTVPAVNRAERQIDGASLLRLGTNDLMLVSDLEGRAQSPQRLAQLWDSEPNPPQTPRGFPMPRQEGFCWFALSGAKAAQMMAKLCGVDLRPHKFAVGQIAQTSVARLNAVVARHDFGSVPGYYLFADSASAEYWWDCFIDAMQEFNGKVVGLSALRILSAR